MSDTEEKPRGKPIIIRNATDLQRLKLEKLMKNPDKEILIPEKPKERGMPVIPEFVRNVMGSSAGAGSGEFHVYRHLRRKEYARQKFMKEKGERERLEDEYHDKLQDNKRKADEKTAKKRAKRLKRKEKAKSKPKTSKDSESESEGEESDSNKGSVGSPKELKNIENLEDTNKEVENVVGVENKEPTLDSPKEVENIENLEDTNKEVENKKGNESKLESTEDKSDSDDNSS